MKKVISIIIILFYFFAVIGGIVYSLAVGAWPLAIAIAGLAAMGFPIFRQCFAVEDLQKEKK